MTPIYHFFHCYATGHWETLVEEHINNLIDSDLYEAFTGMEIGFIGGEAERERIERIIEPYHKMSIRTTTEDPTKYEYHTLSLIEKKCQESEIPFYIYYSHTKGCSFDPTHPAHMGGKTWFDYMEHFNCKKWRDAVKVLDFGYECYGVKLWDSKTSPSQTLHYSGNSFWATSNYASRWTKIKDLNTQDRFAAETQLCGSKSPIAFTACQLFIDYSCKKTFQELIEEGSVKEF